MLDLNHDGNGFFETGARSIIYKRPLYKQRCTQCPCKKLHFYKNFARKLLHLSRDTNSNCYFFLGRAFHMYKSSFQSYWWPSFSSCNGRQPGWLSRPFGCLCVRHRVSLSLVFYCFFCFEYFNLKKCKRQHCYRIKGAMLMLRNGDALTVFTLKEAKKCFYRFSPSFFGVLLYLHSLFLPLHNPFSPLFIFLSSLSYLSYALVDASIQYHRNR